VVNGAIATPCLRAEARSYHWNQTEDQLLKYEHYQLGILLPQPQGNVQGRLSQSERFLSFGKISFVVPHLPMVIRLPQGQLTLMVCTFEPAFFNRITDLQPRIDEARPEILFNIKNTQINALMRRMHRELEEPGFASELFIESTGNLLLIELARYFACAMTPQEHRRKYSGLAPWQLRRIEERIQGSLSLGWPTIAEISELCRLSEDHAMRSFKASAGITLHKRIEESRLGAAKELLSADHLTLKEVASHLGFSSQAYFCRAFRRYTEMTPSQYRALMQHKRLLHRRSRPQ
jgi:AraC-like DNA-binding protein